MTPRDCHDVTLLRWAATSCGAGAVLWRAGDWTQAAQLRGHKREVTQLAFSSCAGDAETETGDTEPEAITCSYDRVILWSVAQLVAKKVSRCQCGARVHPQCLSGRQGGGGGRDHGGQGDGGHHRLQPRQAPGARHLISYTYITLH